MSVDATARGPVSIATDLKGRPIVYDASLTPGADTTNGVQAVVYKPQSNNTYALTWDNSSAAETSSVSKNAAGTLYYALFYNGNGATRYFQVFNSATVPADGVVPVITIPVTTGQTLVLDFSNFGMYFSTGISWCNSTTGGTKTIGAADSLAQVGVA
ncbi:MAG: hypothetical protein A2309_02950 [Bacteroidetes bacterium RIFOXYB2_FULL_35_7]|nr:MAG: hypothetical protein A2309_02950 [Bacteroidetes bacterium RIFOXYB2_FULL_35_7]